MTRDKWPLVWAMIFIVLAFLMFVAFATAQAPPIAVDLSKAQFRWVWEQAQGGVVDKWHIRCGPSAGSYTLLKEIPDPAARSVAMSQVIQAEGTYYCILSAVNAFGASGPSPEVSFRAGSVPRAASAFEVFLP